MYSRLSAFAVLFLAPAALGQPPAGGQSALPAGARLQLGTLALRHTSPVHARLRFGPDGKTLFSCDGTGVILWDLRTGQPLRTYRQGWLFALSPDGKLLGLRGNIDELHVVDVATGKTLHTVTCANDWIRCAAFSADSATLFTGGDQRTIRSWQAADGKAVRKFAKAAGLVYWLAAGADDKTCLCLAASATDKVQVFDTATGKPLRTLGKALAVAATPDGKTAVGSRDDDVILYDPAAGKERLRFRGNDGDISVLAVAPDGKAVAVAGYDDEFRLYDLSTGKPARVLPGLRGPVYGLAFSGDGSLLAAAGWGGVIRIWDWRSGTELLNEGHRAAVVGLAFTPDGKTLFTRGLDATVRAWDLSAGKEIRRFPSHDGVSQPQPTFAIFQALDHRSLLRSTADGLAVADWTTGKDFAPAFVPRGLPAALSPDGTRLLTYRWQDAEKKQAAAVTYTLWDLARGEKIQEFTHSFKDLPAVADAGAGPAAVAIAPDGKSVATSWLYLRQGAIATQRVGHGVSLWDVATGQEHSLGAGPALNLAFLDGGKTLACADRHDDTVGAPADRPRPVMEFWDVASGKKVRTLEGPAELGDTVAFSPDGKLFATIGGRSSRTVCLWRTATGVLLKQFGGHRHQVECLAFSPDGHVLASGSRDGNVLLWEVLAFR
jgi:WD40 repeat protein